MNRLTKWMVGALCAVALVTSTFAATNTVARAKSAPAQTVQAESWVLTLGGVGNTATTGADTAFGVDLSIGRTGHLLLPLEAGVRQSISYGDGSTTLNTRIYGDWTVLTVKKLDLFAGGAVGLQYGNQTPSWEIAPEAGVRYWVKTDAALVGRVEVPWNLANWEFKDTVRYFLGVQIKL